MRFKRVIALVMLFFIFMTEDISAIDRRYQPFGNGIRNDSEYTTSRKDNKKYYRYEFNYTDRENYRHNYYEEFYYSSDNKRYYYVEDFYYDDNNNKVYVIKKNLTEKEYDNLSSYYFDYYGRDYYDLYDSDYYRDGRYRYGYRREDSFYDKKRKNGRDYYVYENEYYDRDDRKHYYKEEYYYKNGYRQYSIEDYYYKNGKKIYEIDESFDERDDRYYKNGPNKYDEYYRYNSYRYGYRRDDSFYKQVRKNGKTYYVYEDEYYDRDDNKYYFKEEYYYKDGYRQYYIEDYYYSNGGKTYLFKESFDERDKKSTPYYYNQTEENQLYNKYFNPTQIVTPIQKKTDKLRADSTNERTSVNEKIMAERNTNSDNYISGYPRLILMKEGEDILVRGFENYASDKINLGTKVVKRGEHLLVPIAKVSNNLGIISEYNPEKKCTTLKKGADEIVIYNSSSDMIVNGKTQTMGIRSEIIANTIMTPVTVLENFGYRDGEELIVNNYLGTIKIRN